MVKITDKKLRKGPKGATTFLYIRTYPGDEGIRPIPSGQEFWISPDIETYVNDPQNNHPECDIRVDDYKIPVGRNCCTRITVNNLGDKDAICDGEKGVYVHLYVADPSTAFNINNIEGINGIVKIAVNGNLKTTSPPHESFNWTPTEWQLGHRCFLTRLCYPTESKQSPTAPDSDCYDDEVAWADLDCEKNIDVINDRHWAQKNIHIIKTAKKVVSFGFLVVNPSIEKKSRFAIETSELVVEKNKKLLKQALGNKFSRLSKTPVADIGIDLGKRIKHRTANESGEKSKKLSVGVIPVKSPSFEQKTCQLDMKPGEQRLAKINIKKNLDAADNKLNIIQVRQINLVTKNLVGGMWLILENQPIIK